MEKKKEGTTWNIDCEEIGQIQLPDPSDSDPHPRILLVGRGRKYGIHAGEGFEALFPDGWRHISLEVSWNCEGAWSWYIATPGFRDVCPVGLFVKL